MKRSIKLYLGDILQSVEDIESFSKGLSKEKLMKNKLRLSAIIRQIEIIGEATKNIPDSIRVKYPKPQWKKIAGTRDIITHHYFGVDTNAIWDVIKKEIPILKAQIKEILKDFEK